jgi:uncharacterized protein
LKLLDVQDLDSRIDGLAHQLRSMPETAALAELAARRTASDNAARDFRIQVSDLTDEQRRADTDVEQVKARRVRDQAMMDGGQVKDPKALERMLGEMESLQRRITSLEDTELEVMERLEAAQTALDERTAEVAELDARIAELEAARSAKAGDIERQVRELTAERGVAVQGLPDDLVTLYEKLRASKGGVGAAALRRRECGGCRLTLNASDLAIIAKAPTDLVVRCEECDRILVRTGESGL